MALLRYPCEEFYDEIFASSHTPRPVAEQFVERLNALSEGELQLRQHSAEATLQSMGITFAVYGNEAGAEKIWPFDIVPRIVRRSEWSQIEA
ncbi:MAG: circularly permuted type 2 ATP-grasp protein, partial [bacterium]|nr:circularly permuted type 2 ATP-grasp protein [bacterium]